MSVHEQNPSKYYYWLNNSNNIFYQINQKRQYSVGQIKIEFGKKIVNTGQLVISKAMSKHIENFKALGILLHSPLDKVLINMH
jgi:hypothetical protein